MPEVVRYEPMLLMWIIVLTGVLLSILGLFLRLSTWLEGEIGPLKAGDSKLRKFGYFLGKSILTFFSGRFWRRIGGVLANGLVHLRLKKQSGWRWIMHLGLLFGFTGLFVLSQTTGVFVDFLPPVFHLQTKLGADMANKDTPWFALLNEGLGALLLAGLCIALVRRFSLRSRQTLTRWKDQGVLLFLLAIVLTGYVAEAARLVAQHIPAEAARYSFVGAPLAGAIRGWNLPWDWKQVHVGVWLFHITVSVAFFVYLPFSKMFHVFASPFLTTWQTVYGEGTHLEHETRIEAAGKGVQGNHEQGIKA